MKECSPQIAGVGPKQEEECSGRHVDCAKAEAENDSGVAAPVSRGLVKGKGG